MATEKKKVAELLETEFEAHFEEDKKQKVEEILDRLDIQSELRARKEILRSIKRQDGKTAVIELKMLQMTQMMVLLGIGLLGGYLTNKYVCNRF